MIIWLADQYVDRECYNLISQTKKELVDQLKELGLDRVQKSFKNVWKIEIDTKNIFNLISYLTGEGGGRNSYMGKTISHYKIIVKNEKVQFEKLTVNI